MTWHPHRPAGMRGRALTCLAILVAMSAASTTPAEASTRRDIVLKAKHPTVTAGQKVLMSGRVSGTPTGQRVLVQRRVGRSWTTVRSVRTTSARGTFATNVVADRTSTYRALAPRTKRLARAISPKLRLSVRPAVTLTAPPLPNAVPAPAPVPSPPEGPTIRVSRGINGARIDGYAERQSVSADGRYIAYVSNASNIVPSEGETGRSVYLWDRNTKTNVRISGFFDGYEFTDDSGSPVVSKDGRFLAFRSSTQGEFLGYPRRSTDHVFLWDGRTGAMKRISQAPDGGDANNGSYPTSVSADGRYVLFNSHASNIVPGDTNNSMDVFMWDGQTGTTTMISRASDGTGTNGHSRHASASDDGRYVAYQSEATNIVAGDTNSAPDVFVLDRWTGTTRMTPDALESSTSGTFLSMITRNGRFVTYVRRGPDAGAGFAAKTDLLVWDLTTDSRDRVTMAADGTAISFAGGSISDDGQFVTYSSWASNIVADDTNMDHDVFLWDRSTRSTLMVSRASNGAGLNAESTGAVISADGRYVTYSSNASNAPDSPSNPYFWANLFSWDRVSGSPVTDGGP